MGREPTPSYLPLRILECHVLIAPFLPAHRNTKWLCGVFSLRAVDCVLVLPSRYLLVYYSFQSLNVLSQASFL